MVLISIFPGTRCSQTTNTKQEGLGRRYQIPIYVGFVLVIGSFLASVITIFSACQPFHKNWQINPDPGSEITILSWALKYMLTLHLDTCQPAISKPVIAVTFAGNLLTDPYLIFIPIPMLWKSSLKPVKKIAATIVLSAGVFVLVCATMKSVMLLVVSFNTVIFPPVSRYLSNLFLFGFL